MRKIYFIFIWAILVSGIVNAQMAQVTDISPDGNSGISDPFVYNGEIYFEADDGSDVGDELYKLDADGNAYLFLDINQDTADSSPNSDPGNFIIYNDLLYFNANDGDNTGHDKELWVTDGTVENTRMVYDIYPGEGNGSNPQQLFVFNNKLYFQANDGTSTQWWSYDGTNDPVKVTNLNEGGFATPMWPIVDEENNIVYFQANNGRNELHVMHADETTEIIDINPDNHGYNGMEAILFNGKLIFQGDDGVTGDELWISDGTAEGTMMLKDIYATGDENSDPEDFTIYNDKVYFAAETETGLQLWVTDGTAEGTMMVAEPATGADGEVENLYVYNGKLYFAATNGTNGVELWVYDGTDAMMVKDINATGDSDPAGFMEVAGLLFFEADAGEGTTLWVTDGTAENTLSAAEATNSSVNPTDVNADEFVTIGTKLYFTADDANGDELFRIDAQYVMSEIAKATEINTSGNSGISNPFVYNGEIYFEADDGSDVGDELYKLDADGNAYLFLDINQDTADSSPNSDPGNFIIYNDLLYFNANDGDNTGHDKELWVTDGTVENTRMVYDIYPGEGNGSNPQQLFVFNNKLYFQANDGTSTQWWSYDGTNDPVKVTNLNEGGFATPMWPIVDEENNIVYFQANNGRNELHVMHADETTEIIDINPDNHGYNGMEAILFNGKLIFQGDDGVTGDELWISDGTAEGTMMLKDIYATGDENSDPEDFTIYNDKVYFAAETETGLQLWVTDGTAEGTMMVAEPATGADGEVENLYVYNGKLYFAATNGTNGVELWVYDGTDAMMVKDINATGDSDPAGFMEVAGLLFFEANAGEGTTLWITDGTAEKTLSAAEATNSSVNPTDVNADEFVTIGTKLYYTADDSEGDEFFVVDAAGIFGYTVTFEVVSNETPLANVTVEFAGAEMITNAEGVAEFTEVQAGTELVYTITLAGFNAQSGTVTVENSMTVEINLIKTGIEKPAEAQLSIYPNPSNGVLHIDGLQENASYKVYDLNQRLISCGTILHNTMRIDAAPGLYFLHINGENVKTVEKIIIR